MSNVQDILGDDDFAAFERDYTALISKKAAQLVAAGALPKAFEAEAFDKRLAKIAAEVTDDVNENEIRPFGLSLDTMHALTPGFFDFQFNSRLLRAVESIVGPEITLSPIQHCRPFLPTRNGAKNDCGVAVIAPWHQDQGVTREEADGSEILTVWIPLTDVKAETGCLKVIPGAQSGGGGGG